MVNQPYFMTNKDWYTINEEGEYLLTDKAPKQAVKDYNERKTEFLKRMATLTADTALDINEDEDWLIFPIN